MPITSNHPSRNSRVEPTWGITTVCTRILRRDKDIPRDGHSPRRPLLAALDNPLCPNLVVRGIIPDRVGDHVGNITISNLELGCNILALDTKGTRLMVDQLVAYLVGESVPGFTLGDAVPQRLAVVEVGRIVAGLVLIVPALH